MRNRIVLYFGSFASVPTLPRTYCVVYLFHALQVKSVLQQLTAMNPNPTIGLAEAAEMLCKHLGVALVRYRHCSLRQPKAGCHGYCQAMPMSPGSGQQLGTTRFATSGCDTVLCTQRLCSCLGAPHQLCSCVSTDVSQDLCMYSMRLLQAPGAALRMLAPVEPLPLDCITLQLLLPADSADMSPHPPPFPACALAPALQYCGMH
jgi:hypothetical protein